jgi:plastocyanin
MTCRWYIFFSLLPALPATASVVTGQLELADSKEPAVRKRKDYSGVVVWLEPVRGKAPLPQGRVHTILQKGKRFSPHISAVPMGTVVDFPNLDPIFHNAFSNFSGQPFDTGLYPPGSTHKIRFTRPGIVRIFCNIHSMMSAVIAVLETPWFTVSQADGSYRIEDVPPGEYRMRFWHERSPETVLEKLERRVTVPEGELLVHKTVLSESGYLELPHKNKYGREYPPEPGGSILYSGGGR